jgi:hypothetical protein
VEEDEPGFCDAFGEENKGFPRSGSCINKSSKFPESPIVH